jgi:hypothetical protein
MDNPPERIDLDFEHELAELADRLLEAASAGRFAEELSRAKLDLEALEGGLGPTDILRARILFFDLAQVSTSDRGVQARTAVDLLGFVDANAWNSLLSTGRIYDVQQLAGEPECGIELAELLSYSPDEGIRDFAVAELEGAGMRAVASGEDIRSIERLLHAAGARDAAYRLEAARKRTAHNESPVSDVRGSRPTIPYRTIAIAGGHAQLRGAAASVLDPYGVSVVAIPSSQEAVRRERDILHLLNGCDLALLLVRQITHSTSDQVRKTADRLGVPVVFSKAASAVAIERQLLELSRATAKE